MSSVRFLAEWHDDAQNAALEDRATIADFRLCLGQQNVTRHLDGDASVDHVTISLYGLVEGIAHDWWRIFGDRDRTFSLMNYRTGYAVPDLRMSFDGLIFHVEAHQRMYRNPDVRFWAGPTEILDRSEAEHQLDGFVEEVLQRLDQRGVGRTSAALRWARVKASRADVEEASFCEAAGALGADPYQIDDEAARSIEDAATLFKSEPLTEFLTGARGKSASELIEWVRNVEERPPYQSRIADLQSIAVQASHDAPSKSKEAAWSLGYRRARSMRRILGLQTTKRFSSYRTLAEMLGASKSFKLTPDVDGIRVLRSNREDGIHLHMRMHGASAKKELGLFSFCRAVGDAVCFPEEARAPINDLQVAYRQAAGRAFAAEFLAPVAEIQSMQESGRDVVSMAEEFGVSTTLIERQLENKPRIEKACA